MKIHRNPATIVESMAMNRQKKSNRNSCKNNVHQKLSNVKEAGKDNRHDENSISTAAIRTATIKSEGQGIESTPEDTVKNFQAKIIPTTNKFQCDMCSKSFAHKNSLHLHKRIHSGVKPFHCVECDQSFARSDYYVAHQRKHNIESQSQKSSKGFGCKICNNVFAYKHVLRRHQDMHYNQMNFSCSICDMKFQRKDYLTAHVRVSHAKENLFKCKFCNKVFHYKKSLVIHERRHTGERPYACCFCNKQFMRKDYMQQHQYAHELECDKLTCDFCHTVFKKKCDLRDHILKHLVSKESDTEKNSLLVTEKDSVRVFINSNSCDDEYYDETDTDPLLSVIEEDVVTQFT